VVWYCWLLLWWYLLLWYCYCIGVVSCYYCIDGIVCWLLLLLLLLLCDSYWPILLVIDVIVVGIDIIVLLLLTVDPICWLLLLLLLTGPVVDCCYCYCYYCCCYLIVLLLLLLLLFSCYCYCCYCYSWRCWWLLLLVLNVVPGHCCWCLGPTSYYCVRPRPGRWWYCWLDIGGTVGIVNCGIVGCWLMVIGGWRLLLVQWWPWQIGIVIVEPSWLDGLAVIDGIDIVVGDYCWTDVITGRCDWWW